MTITELGLATKSAATLSTSTATKALLFHGPGKRTGEVKPHPTIRDPAGYRTDHHGKTGLESVAGS
jgi:hypothetical protein